MKTLKLFSLLLFYVTTTLAQRDLDIPTILGPEDKYTSNTFSNIQEANYGKYTLQRYYRVLIEGDFGLIPELSEYKECWNSNDGFKRKSLLEAMVNGIDPIHHIASSGSHPCEIMARICLYYLRYIDRYCPELLGDSTLNVKREHSWTSEEFSHVDTEFDGSDVNVSNVYNTVVDKYVLEMKINPKYEEIFNWCDDGLNPTKWSIFSPEELKEITEIDLTNINITKVDVRVREYMLTSSTDYVKFFHNEIKYDRKTLETMGENIIRMLQNRPSLQQEQGYY